MSQNKVDKSNCELDNCTPLDSLKSLIANDLEDDSISSAGDNFSPAEDFTLTAEMDVDNLSFDECNGLSPVAGILLKTINIQENCMNCEAALFKQQIFFLRQRLSNIIG